MHILSLFFNFLLAPLVFVYSMTFNVCKSIFGYGYGLLALSLLITLLVLPLRRIVKRSQDREKTIQSILAPQIRKIKMESTGDERYRRIRDLYARYSYHPVFAIRAVFGLLLQVPFFIAAYRMIGECGELDGVPFGPIFDLGKPDALIFGELNVLPILMTLFNVLAVFLMDGTSREKIQAYFLAVFFLLILYGAPSAMLLYWTGNNFLSLLSTVVENRGKRGENAE